MREFARQGYIAPANFAHVPMALGQHDQALEALEQSLVERSGWILPFLVVDPMFDPLRADPGFRDLQARISARELVAAR